MILAIYGSLLLDSDGCYCLLEWECMIAQHHILIFMKQLAWFLMYVLTDEILIAGGKSI
jgi:hypothetical protein